MIFEQIDKLIADSMKQHNKEELNVYRLIKSKFVEFETSGKDKKLTNDDEIKILRKMVSQREESRRMYLDAGRDELAENELKEIKIISQFVPEEPSEDMIRTVILEYRDSKDDKELSVKDMKPIMNAVKEKYSIADGKIISKILSDIINKK